MSKGYTWYPLSTKSEYQNYTIERPHIPRYRPVYGALSGSSLRITLQCLNLQRLQHGITPLANHTQTKEDAGAHTHPSET